MAGRARRSRLRRQAGFRRALEPRRRAVEARLGRSRVVIHLASARFDVRGLPLFDVRWPARFDVRGLPLFDVRWPPLFDVCWPPLFDVRWPPLRRRWSRRRLATCRGLCDRVGWRLSCKLDHRRSAVSMRRGAQLRCAIARHREPVVDPAPRRLVLRRATQTLVMRRATQTLVLRRVAAHRSVILGCAEGARSSAEHRLGHAVTAEWLHRAEPEHRWVEGHHHRRVGRHHQPDQNRLRREEEGAEGRRRHRQGREAHGRTKVHWRRVMASAHM